MVDIVGVLGPLGDSCRLERKEEKNPRLVFRTSTSCSSHLVSFTEIRVLFAEVHTLLQFSLSVFFFFSLPPVGYVFMWHREVENSFLC